MARIGRSLQDLAAEIQRRAEAKRDFIAPATKLAVEVVDKQPVITMQGKADAFPLQDVAHGQLATYTGIPLPYYRRMLEQKPELFAKNVNTWLQGMPASDRRMLRTLDGKARALLSDSFRPLDNFDLANAVLPVLVDDEGVIIVSCEITDRRLYIKAIHGDIQRDVPTGRKMGDGSHCFFDTCCPAITISNSEVGHGSLSIESGVYTKACTNLAMFGANMKKYHVGKRADMSEEMFEMLTDETKRATDKAVWMQARDLVKGAFNDAKFEATLKKLGEAAQDVIPAEAVGDVVEVVGKRFSFNEGERKGILGRLIEGSDLTRYGLHAAITRHSQDTGIDYDRATELERIGGELVELPKFDWQRFMKDAKATA